MWVHLLKNSNAFVEFKVFKALKYKDKVLPIKKLEISRLVLALEIQFDWWICRLDHGSENWLVLIQNNRFKSV